MEDNEIRDGASMLGLPRRDSEKLVHLVHRGTLPPKEWLDNYRVSNPAQRATIIKVLREQ